jgi:hypothetical protein
MEMIATLYGEDTEQHRWLLTGESLSTRASGMIWTLQPTSGLFEFR